jgi:predicted transcriptional regulator
MSRSITTTTGEAPSRGTFFKLDPFDIVVLEEWRGRWTAPDMVNVQKLARSMFEHGQAQNVVCRALEDKRVQLVSGFTRTAAARLIRVGFTCEDGTEIKDTEFTLNTTVVDCDDLSALIRNSSENAIRLDLSPADKAISAKRLKDNGMKQKDIADLFGIDEPAVSRLLKLLDMSDAVLMLVHTGKMKQSVALELLNRVPADQWEDAIVLMGDELTITSLNSAIVMLAKSANTIITEAQPMAGLPPITKLSQNVATALVDMKEDCPTTDNTETDVEPANTQTDTVAPSVPSVDNSAHILNDNARTNVPSATTTKGKNAPKPLTLSEIIGGMEVIKGTSEKGAWHIACAFGEWAAGKMCFKDFRTTIKENSK